MNRLSKEEFSKRSYDIARAKDIFIPHVTKNISIAYEMYLSVIDGDMELLAITKDQRPDNFIGDLKRPTCSKCGVDLYLREIKEPKGPANKNGWKSCWICAHCLYENYSTLSIDEQVDKLKKGTIS